MIPERIDDHCFEPQADLRDECAYAGCGKSELIHCWTVEAYRANPDFPSRDALIRLANRQEADNKALLDENERLKGELAMAEGALGIRRRLAQITHEDEKLDWWCFSCSDMVTESHLEHVFDRGGQTGACKLEKATDAAIEQAERQ